MFSPVVEAGGVQAAVRITVGAAAANATAVQPPGACDTLPSALCYARRWCRWRMQPAIHQPKVTPVYVLTMAGRVARVCTDV